MKTKSLLDKEFKYVSAAATDISKTFARVRKEQAAQKKAEEERFVAIPRIGKGVTRGV